MTVTVISGADGLVGAATARWLLAHSDRELHLLVRARDADELRVKQRLLPAGPRCRVIASDLRNDRPVSLTDCTQVSEVLHCAAVTEFSVTRADAQAVNVEGTRKLVAFAERCPKLRSFGYVSTIYSAGLSEGALYEGLQYSEPGFANHYEWSKWRAEQYVSSASSLPWQIFRLSTIVADSTSGVVTRQNAIHNTFRLLFYGWLPVVAGDSHTRVYTVTTDFVAEALGALLLGAETRRVFHVSEAGDSAATLGCILDDVFEIFLREPDFFASGILKPRFCDQGTFTRLVAGARTFGMAATGALESVVPFAPQLFRDKIVANDRTVAALDGRRPPCGIDLIRATATHLVETRWGLR